MVGVRVGVAALTGLGVWLAAGASVGGSAVGVAGDGWGLGVGVADGELVGAEEGGNAVGVPMKARSMAAVDVGFTGSNA